MHGRTITPSTGRRHWYWTGPEDKGISAEGGPAHTDDNSREALQPGQRTEVLGCWTTLMMRHVGRSNQHHACSL